MEKVPQPSSKSGEVMQSDHLQRGEIRKIIDEITYHEHQAAKNPVGRLNIETYDLGPLHAAHREGFDYVMRLPRVNEAACVAKYGGYYDKLQKYTDFVKTLASRNGITEFKVIDGPRYVFRSKEDAEKLSQKLIEQQEKAELEFEIIEGNHPPSIPDQNDTNR